MSNEIIRLLCIFLWLRDNKINIRFRSIFPYNNQALYILFDTC